MFHGMRNIVKGGTPTEEAVLATVRRRLPAGWVLEPRPSSGATPDLILRGPDGRYTLIEVKSRRRLEPRDIPNLTSQANELSEMLVVAPFLSPRSRELLAEGGASYVDATGNLRLAASDPAVFIEEKGSDRDPNRERRGLRSLKGAAAGRTVRALCDFFPPYGVRELAQISSTPLGTVSRVVSFLDQEALITRDDRKRVLAVDWRALIKRWVVDYSVLDSNRVSFHLEARGLSALPEKLSNLDRYAVTGSMAGPGLAPARLAMIYVENAERTARTLDLAPTEAGANVWLLEPYDDVVFERTRKLPVASGMRNSHVVGAAASQVAADLLTSPGRGPQEATEMIETMKRSERDWRHRP